MMEMSAMPVTYLSQEWIEAYNAALAGDDAVRAALKGKSAALQMVISGAPQGDVRYSGTKAPSTTMSLLPVPRSPTVSHTSSIT
jgi:hypothetical protein